MVDNIASITRDNNFLQCLFGNMRQRIKITLRIKTTVSTEAIQMGIPVTELTIGLYTGNHARYNIIAVQSALEYCFLLFDI